jgi:large subunit ribosomal protein L30
MSSKTPSKRTTAKKSTAPILKAEKTDKSSQTIKVSGDKKESNESSELLCVLRVRGAHGMRRTIQQTLHLLKLFRVNHVTVIQNNPSVKGMLQKAKDYIAFGPISLETLKKLLKKRALLAGNKPLSDSHIVNETTFKSVDDLAKGLYEGKIKFKEIKDLKPVFRLHPPIGGYKGSIKKASNAGGVLGNVGDKINDYLKKMI